MPGRHIAKIADNVERILGAIAVLAFRRPLQTLLILAALTAGASTLMGRLAVNADLAELLPKSFASVRALDQLRVRFGGQGFVTVLAHDAPPEALKRFADDLAPRLEALPGIRYVDHRRPSRFFETHALYFLNVEDLQDLRGRLEEREAYERRKANPLYVDLEDDEEPPSLSIEELRSEYAGRGETSFMAAQMGESYYIDPEQRVIAILAKPSRISLDLDASRELVSEVEGALAQLDLSRYAPGMWAEVAGSYKKKVDQQDVIGHDLQLSSTVAFVLIFVFLALHFRRLSAVGLVLVPLGMGVVWSYAFAGWAFGTLNILTAFIGAVLSGMGIENGIHLLGRFEHEWAEHQDPETSIRRTFGNTGRGVAVTAVTTMMAFLGISLSEFRAFHEFGVIAAVGMLLFVIAYAVCLPALLGLALRMKWQPRPVGDESVPRIVDWIIRRARAVFVTSLVVLALLATLVPRVEFNFNLRSLLSSNLRSFELDQTIDRLLGYSTTPAVVLTDTREEERHVARVLRERVDALGGRSTVRFIASSADLVPDNQLAKRVVIREIGDILRRVDREKLSAKDRKAYDLVTDMVHTEPFDEEALPVEVKRQFQAIDGSTAGFVLVFASIDLSDGALVRQFAETVRGVELPGGNEAPVAGEAMVLADIFIMVAQDAPPVLAFAIGLVFLTLWLMVGNLRSAVACLLPAAATLIATLGLMPLAHMSLNYINIVMIPLFFGIGIDGGAHLNTRLDTGAPFAQAFAETGRGVTASLLTNAFGFCALLIADHSGLNTLGQMALVGLAINLLACCVALPAYVAWRLRVQPTTRD